MKHIKVTAVLASAFIVAAGLSACGGGDEAGADGPIRVAAIQTTSGTAAQTGEPQVAGLKLAFKKINADGGVDGRKIKVTYFDDKGDPAEAVKLAQKVVQDGGYVAVVAASLSANTIGIQGVTEDAGLPLLDALSAADQIISPDTKMTFRVTGPVKSELIRLHKYAVDNQYAKLAMLHSTDGWGLSGSDDKGVLEGDGTTLVTDVAHETNTADFSTQIAKLKKADPDAIVMWNLGGDGGKFVKQVRSQGWDVPILGGRAFGYPVVFDLAGDAAMEGTVRTDAIDETKPEAKALLDYATKEFGSVKYQPDLLAQSYDAGMVLAKAMEKGTSPEQIRDGFYAIKDYTGASGGTGSSFAFSASDHDGAKGDNYVNIKVAKGGAWTSTD